MKINIKSTLFFIGLSCLLFSCKNEQKNTFQKQKSIQENKVKNGLEKLQETTLNTSIDTAKVSLINNRLAEIKSSLINHQWQKFLSFSDPVILMNQQETGMSDEQHIFELLNITTDADTDYQQVIQETMSQIKDVTFDTSGLNQELGDYVDILGTITLYDGSKKSMTLVLMMSNPPLITGAVG